VIHFGAVGVDGPCVGPGGCGSPTGAGPASIGGAFVPSGRGGSAPSCSGGVGTGALGGCDGGGPPYTADGAHAPSAKPIAIVASTVLVRQNGHDVALAST
jgi:hypothetical protein